MLPAGNLSSPINSPPWRPPPLSVSPFQSRFFPPIDLYKEEAEEAQQTGAAYPSAPGLDAYMAPHGEHDGLVSNSRSDISSSDGHDCVGTELTNKGTVRQKRWTTRGRTGCLTCRFVFLGRVSLTPALE